MSKITKKELRQRCIDNETAIARLESILKENGIKRQPQLKQLDQSVFNGAHEMWKFASVDADGAGFRFAERPELTDCFWRNTNCSRFDRLSQSGAYDTTDWQNSLIERDVDKELLEVDLSSELTGSDLCRKMLERGDKFILCSVDDRSDNDAINDLEIQVIGGTQFLDFVSQVDNWKHAVPINNQGEPLTASEAGL